MSSIIIARLLGPLMLVSAAAILLNRKGIREATAATVKNPALIYISGVITLLGGLAIAQFHNDVSTVTNTLITVLGYMMIGHGATRMLIPDRLSQMGKLLGQQRGVLEVSAAISGVIGIILTAHALQKL